MISMTKGQVPVSLGKARRVRVRMSWPPATDYDLGAEVLYTDGRTESIAAFGARLTPARQTSTDGAVRQLGDVQRSGAATAEEILEVDLNPGIRAVLPWAYSAQSNGTGSFHRYQVTLEVDDGQGNTVRITADDAADDDHVYTCAPGMIENTENGVQVHALYRYSAPDSENRPRLGLDRQRITLDMNAGPRNNRK